MSSDPNFQSTPKSTTRAQTRADALAALPPVPGATSVPANGSSQALAPPVKDPPAPPPPPPPSVASEAFPQSNARLVSVIYIIFWHHN